MLAKLFIASIRANLGRTLLSVAGIALGVALGLAVHVINQSAISEMQQATRTLSGDADLTLRGGRASAGGFDEAVLETLLTDARIAPLIAIASPIVDMTVALPPPKPLQQHMQPVQLMQEEQKTQNQTTTQAAGKKTGPATNQATNHATNQTSQTIRVIGTDIFQAARLQPGFVGEAFKGGRAEQQKSADDRAMPLATLQPDSVFLNRAALAVVGAQTNGSTSLSIPIGLENKTINVIGKIELPQFKEPLAVMDIAGAQVLFNQVGKLSRIDLRLRPGVNIESFRSDVLPLLPPGLALTTPQQRDEQSAAVSRAYRINLTVLSLVALFTGGFLVFSTQSLSVVRRRSQFALYRTLGVTQRELLRALLAEGAVLGTIGGATGAALGLAIATLALKKFGADLGSGFFAGVVPEADWHVATVLFFVGLGSAAGVVGAWLPARQAALEAPARALKANDDAGGGATFLPPWWAGATLLVLSAALLALPAIDSIPWLAYASIAAMLFGVIALAPIICAKALSLAPQSKSIIRQLAARHIEKSPGPSAAAITGIVASFSLMIAMLIMVVSFRASLEDWLTGVLKADIYVRVGRGNSPGSSEANTLDTSTGAAFQAIRGVEHADYLRYKSVNLNPDMAPVALIVRPLRDDVLASLTMLRRADANVVATAQLPIVWVSEAMVDLYGLDAGQTVTVPIEGVARKLIIGGVWRDYARSSGAITIDRDAYIAMTGDTRINDLALTLTAGADKLEVMNAIRAMPNGDRFEIINAAEIRKLSLSAFDRSFAVTYALEIAAIFVGLAGISATFSAQAWARRREFGMLRHLGMTRGEIRRLLGAEGTLLGSLGAAIGLVLGFAIALVLIFVVNRQSFHWSMELHIPWLTLAILSVALIGLTAVSAIISGRFSMSRQAVLAVKEDA